MKKSIGEPLLFVVTAAIVASLVLFVLYPILQVFLYPKMSDFAAVATNPRYVKAILTASSWSCSRRLSSTLLGFIFAYTAARTDVPGRKFFKLVSLLPLFSPPFMVAFSYIHDVREERPGHRRAPGPTSEHLRLARPLARPDHSLFPVASLVMEGVLRSISPSLEYAGRNLGATGFTLFRTVTLPPREAGRGRSRPPRIHPGLADFGNPIMISGDFSVVATEAWMRVEGWADVSGAAILSLFLLAPSLVNLPLPALLGRKEVLRDRHGEDRPDRHPEDGALHEGLPLSLLFRRLAPHPARVCSPLHGRLREGWGFDWTPTTRYVSEIFSRSPRTREQPRVLHPGGGRQRPLRHDRGLSRFPENLSFPPVRGFHEHPASCAAGDLLRDRAMPSPSPGRPSTSTGTAAIIVLSMVFWNISMGYQTGIGAFQQISPSFSEAREQPGRREPPDLPGNRDPPHPGTFLLSLRRFLHPGHHDLERDRVHLHVEKRGGDLQHHESRERRFLRKSRGP